MRCKKILASLNDFIPCDLALDWDNVGLLAGKNNKDVKKIMIGLDLTFDLLKQAIENKVDCIITHHPLIFKAIKKINDDTNIGKKIITLLENDISYIAMHTNYDIAFNCMSDECVRILGLDYKNIDILEEIDVYKEKSVGIGKALSLEKDIKLIELINIIKNKLELDKVVFYGDLEQEVKKIAISPGSGKGMYEKALKKGTQVLISGDITHHEGLDAMEAGVSIIDAGHYGIEKIFIDDLCNKLLKIDKFDIIKYFKDERKFV